MAIDDVSEILDSISKQGASLLKDDQDARMRLLESARSLIAAIEPPSETIRRITEAEPARFAALRIAVDLQLFEKLAAVGHTGAHATELAKATGADVELVARLMRHLAAMHVVREVAEDAWVPAQLGQTLATDAPFRDGILMTHDVLNPCYANLPAYLRRVGHADPGGASGAALNGAGGPFQAAHGTSMSMFEWLGANPGAGRAFNSYMPVARRTKRTWLTPGSYPVAERLSTPDGGPKGPSEGSDVLLVDLGGGLGQDCEGLRTKFPALKGRILLQDRAPVIAQIPKAKSALFEPTVHDFFTPQPIIGARAYYLHSVLHNWDDASCVRILRQLAPALRRGHSRVLVNDFVVPARGAPWGLTGMDFVVMALLAARERTEAQWRALARRAGLQVVGVVTFDEHGDSIVEMELADEEGGPGPTNGA